MIPTVIENVITRNAKLINTLDWATNQLEDLKDAESLKSILKIKEQYRKMIFAIMQENNIKEIVVYPTKNSQMEFKLNIEAKK